MDDKNNLKQVNDYTYETNDTKSSNPFSSALKSINNFLEKINLKKFEQARIGTPETNSRGYQTTSKDPLEATSKKSLKAILRSAFEDFQTKRLEKINAKSSVNTLPVHKIGDTQEINQPAQKDSEKTLPHIKAQELAAQRAAQRAQQNEPVQTLINNSVKSAEITKEEQEFTDGPSAAEITVDESFSHDENNMENTVQDVAQTQLKAETLQVESNNPNKVIIPKQIKSTKPKIERSSDNELSM